MQPIYSLSQSLKEKEVGHKGFQLSRVNRSSSAPPPSQVYTMACAGVTDKTRLVKARKYNAGTRISRGVGHIMKHLRKKVCGVNFFVD